MTYLKRQLPKFVEDVYASVTYLTRLPAPGWSGDRTRSLSASMWAFPLAGVLVATVAGFVYAVCDLLALPVPVSAFAAVAAGVLVTGGLHEDGAADFADGVWGAATTKERLAIMADSRIGAFGVLALIFSVGGRVAAVAAIDSALEVLGALVAAAAASRAVMPVLTTILAPAKEDGQGAAAGRASEFVSFQGVVLAALVVLLAAPGDWIECLLAAAVGGAAIAWVAKRALGGYTGDVLGAAQQLAEVLALAVIAAAVLRID